MTVGSSVHIRVQRCIGFCFCQLHDNNRISVEFHSVNLHSCAQKHSPPHTHYHTHTNTHTHTSTSNQTLANVPGKFIVLINRQPLCFYRLGCQWNSRTEIDVISSL